MICLYNVLEELNNFPMWIFHIVSSFVVLALVVNAQRSMDSTCRLTGYADSNIGSVPAGTCYWGTADYNKCWENTEKKTGGQMTTADTFCAYNG